LLLSMALISSIARAQELRIVAIERNPVSWVASRLLACVYEHAGLRLRVEALPAIRAGLVAATDSADGELLRRHDYPVRSPQLLRVDPSYYGISLVAFSMPDRSVKVQQPADLARYAVASIRGLTTAQTLTDALPGSSPVTLVGSPEQMFQMLQLHRVEVALETRLAGSYTAARLGLRDLVVSPPLARFELHHYLSVRHRALMPRISASIQTMKKSGALDRMTAQFERELMAVDLANWSLTQMPARSACARAAQP